MPVHKLPLILMVCNVQENASFMYTNLKNLPTVGGETPPNPPPPPRSVASLPRFAPAARRQILAAPLLLE